MLLLLFLYTTTPTYTTTATTTTTHITSTVTTSHTNPTSTTLLPLLLPGLSKVQQMMKWVHQQASVPFELGNLPHLSDVDKQRYKDQVS